MISHYKELPIKTLDKWFSELAEIAGKSGEDTALPELALLLKNGSIFRGYIVRLDKEAKMLMVMGLQDPYNNSKGDITFLPAEEVISLTLVEPDLYLKQFVLPAKSEKIGSLELKRKANSINENIKEKFQQNISLQVIMDTIAENDRWYALKVVEMLPSILDNLTSDEIGKSLINEKLNNIELSVADKPATKLDGDTLQIQIKSPIDTPLTMEKNRIISEIESLM